MLAIQDQLIRTKNYRKFILKEDVTDKCRMCGSNSETIQHITGGCKCLAPRDYKDRHDAVAKIIHQKLAIKAGLIQETTPYFKYTPEKVSENTTHKMYWDRGILTDRTVPHNRPDITLVCKESKTAYLIEIAVPNSNNVLETQTHKITKYQDLKNEVKEMWDMNRVEVIPIIISTTGLVPHSLAKNLERIGIEAVSTIEIQAAVIHNTCRTVKKLLDAE